jgi:hypothetical protein
LIDADDMKNFDESRRCGTKGVNISDEDFKKITIL